MFDKQRIGDAVKNVNISFQLKYMGKTSLFVVDNFSNKNYFYVLNDYILNTIKNYLNSKKSHPGK